MTKDIMKGISPLPDLHCLHRGTRKDLEKRCDHYRLCSDPSDTDEVGVHVHHGCFNTGDAKTVAEEIQRRCNSYPDLIAKAGQQAAAIAELVEALVRFEMHYPSGINPYLDETANVARTLIAKHKAGQADAGQADSGDCGGRRMTWDFTMSTRTRSALHDFLHYRGHRWVTEPPHGEECPSDAQVATVVSWFSDRELLSQPNLGKNALREIREWQRSVLQ